jgi:serine phosphatase RsbU (regulator of sigma subunit)
MFREDRMIEALNKDITASVEDIDAAVRSAVADFVKDAPQFDDMTTLVFRYKGTDRGIKEYEN